MYALTKDSAMKITLLVTFTFGEMLFGTTVGATETVNAATAAHDGLRQRATAQALKGDARKTYHLSDCLKEQPVQPGERSHDAATAKMRECNVQATEQSLKGDDRSRSL